MSITVVNLQDNRALFRIFITLLRFSFDSPSYKIYVKYKMAGYFVRTPCLKLKMPCPACGIFSSLNSDKMFHKWARRSRTCSTSRNVLTGTLTRQSATGIKYHFLSLSSLHGLIAASELPIFIWMLNPRPHSTGLNDRTFRYGGENPCLLLGSLPARTSVRWLLSTLQIFVVLFSPLRPSDMSWVYKKNQLRPLWLKN